MAPKKGKGKSVAGSSSSLNAEQFKDAESAEHYESRFINRTVIFERIVKPDGIGTTMFMEWIRRYRLMTLSNLIIECFENWIREFYCNMFDVTANDFKTYVRGNTLHVDVNKIATLLNLGRPEVRCYPFAVEQNIVIEANQVATVLCGRPIIWNSPNLKISDVTTDFRLFNTFVCHNIEPRGHKSDLLYPQAFLLYSLGTGTNVDIPLTIFESMLRIYDEQRQLVLPFGAMICKMMIEAGCRACTHEVPIFRRQKIDARTMTMSDTHVRKRLQREQAQAQVDDQETDSIEDRLSAVECAVFDQSLQIEHLEERVTTGFSEISNQLTQMFNQLRHQ